MKKVQQMICQLAAGFAIAIATLVQATVAIAQEETEHPTVTQGEMAYKGAPIPQGELKRVVSPGAPDMTQDEFDIATKI